MTTETPNDCRAEFQEWFRNQFAHCYHLDQNDPDDQFYGASKKHVEYIWREGFQYGLKRPAPSGDVVERVAKAIIPWRYDQKQLSANWEAMPAPIKNAYRDQARAALAAMPADAPAVDVEGLVRVIEAKWKPSAILVGSPLVRLDEVLNIIRQHFATGAK